MTDEKMAMMQGEIDNLHQKIAFLEQKLKELQENRRIPSNPWDVIGPGSSPPQVYKYKTECTQCGLKMDGPISYSCPHKNCPCGLGSPWCGTGTIS
jgi:hypothetical protein